MIFILTAVLLISAFYLRNKFVTDSATKNSASKPFEYKALSSHSMPAQSDDLNELENHLKILLQKIYKPSGETLSLSPFNLATGEVKLGQPKVSGKKNRDGYPLLNKVELHVGGHCSSIEVAAHEPNPSSTSSELVVDFYYESEWMSRSIATQQQNGEVKVAQTTYCSNPGVASQLLWGMHGRLV